MVQGSQAEARQIGVCLESYASALNAEFQIESSNYVVTAYAVPNESEVVVLFRPGWPSSTGTCRPQGLHKWLK